MKMQVFIVTEGGKGFGFGHVSRCVALAQGFTSFGIEPILIINGDRSILHLIKKTKFKIFDWLKKKDQLLNLIKSARICVLDSYKADAEFCRKISEIVKIPVFIDDFKRLSYPRKGIIVNGSVYANQMQYKRRVAKLLGPRYNLMRKELWEAPHFKVRKQVKNIFLAFGYDLKCFTPEMSDFLHNEYPALTIYVILGREIKEIYYKERFKDNGGVKLIFEPSVMALRRLMLNSDIAISGGGQTLNELIRIGVPTIGICFSKNQEQNLEFFEHLKAIEYIGYYGSGKIFINLRSALGETFLYKRRRTLSNNSRCILDGRGAVRVAKSLIGYSK